MRASKSHVAAVFGLLIFLSTNARSQPNSPQAVLAEADRLAMLYNWPRSIPLYVEAGREFHGSNNAKGKLAARLGWIRAQAYEEPSEALADEVDADLQNPTIQRDVTLMLRCLEAKAAIEEQSNEDSSRATWEKIRDLAKRLGDRRWQARAEAELGIIAFLDGDVGAAAKTLKTALISAYLLGDMGAAIYYGSIVGNGLVEAGQPEAGIKYCDIAIQTAAQTKDMGFPFMAYEGKARGLLALRRNAEARQALDKAIRQAQSQNDLAAESQLLIVRGQQEAAIDRRQAIRDLQSATDFCQKHNFRHALAWSTFELATAYNNAGELPMAGQYAAMAAHETESLEDKYHLPEDLALMADIAASTGQRKQADRLYRRAEDVTDGLLVSLPSRQVESSLIGTMSNIYLGHFRLAVEQKNVSEAFHIIESARGRAIADQLRSGTEATGPKDKITQNARQELNRLQIELLHSVSPSQRKQLLGRLFETEQVLGPGGESRTEVQEATLQASISRLRTIQRSLRPDEAILEYVLDKPQSFCLHISRHRTGVTVLPVSLAEVNNLVAAYRIDIAKRDAATASARRLYSALLQPLQIESLKRRLIIVPDGALNLVPFDALMDGADSYVLTSHVVTYAPSATVLNLIRNEKNSGTTTVMFLGVGDVPYQPSTAGKVDPGAGSTANPGVGGMVDFKGDPLPNLPATKEEVTDAAKVFGSSSVLLLGANATEARFKSEPLDHFRIIHIAAHGIASTRFPDRAALVLGQDSARHDDGLLQVREIRDLHLNAQLVTLSACDTGAGRLEGEEGIESLERAFLFVGARSVLASLWTASDIYTTSLMARFYQHVAAGQDEGEALRQAKLDLLKEFRGPATPFFWADFILTGDASERVTVSK